ncbi:unnamed protein product [Rotaria magnacalcarata]|uniref:G-protein coupled receptors family 1 profile domain-containing protein n=3 Tax=Rotaria magnacalcarata TaxID=392030 RepID=A0A819RTH9_9BILA|nr:unnamed protein product [Rotaria magnacalcarata]CAF4050261.1 unnamed protein product [Rotaria magnacalcarata]
MSLSTSTLVVVQQYLTRYGMTTYDILGNIGSIFNLLIFSQSSHRCNPCSLYIFSMSLCSAIGLNSAVIPLIYALDHPNPLSYSIPFCKSQYYFRHVFSQSMRTFFVVACVDRYASCSNRVFIRSFSRHQIAIRVIPLVIIFWILLGLFPTMLYTISNGVCDAQDGLPNILYSAYIMIVLGILPLVTLFTFGVLMMINLKESRANAQTLGNRKIVSIIRKRDRNMMRMLLTELTIYIITTIPNTVVLIYKVATPPAANGSERQCIESFVFYFARVFLLYLNNSLSFWIYLITSQSFRHEFKKLLFHLFSFVEHKKPQATIVH